MASKGPKAGVVSITTVRYITIVKIPTKIAFFIGGIKDQVFSALLFSSLDFILSFKSFQRPQYKDEMLSTQTRIQD